MKIISSPPVLVTGGEFFLDGKVDFHYLCHKSTSKKHTIMIKRILPLLAGGLLCMSACAVDVRPNYTVNIPVPASLDNTMAYLMDFDSGEKLDSAVVTGGSIVFKGNVSTPFIGRVVVSGQRGPIFIVEPGTVSLDSAGNASGTPLNDRMETYNKLMSELKTRYSKLDLNDSVQAATADSIVAVYDNIPRSAYKENPSSPVGLFWFLQTAYDMDLQALDAAIAADPSLGQSARVKGLRNALLAKAETSEGKHYKDFTVTWNGKEQKFSDYIKPGEYTLVDFWASWCGPCMRQAKVIKELYNKYNGKGLNVVGVAVWDEPANTEKAIKSHGLAWPCIIDAQTIPTDLYGISGIPCILLINPEGIIVSRDKMSNELIEAVDNAMSAYEASRSASAENVPAMLTVNHADTAAIF